VPVPLIYLDEKRAFGGSLDDANRRRAYYYEVLERAVRRLKRSNDPATVATDSAPREDAVR
jgi:dolichol-phosphate mannosyltransferase